MTFILKVSVAKEFDNDYYDMNSAKSIQFATIYKSFVKKFLIKIHIFYKTYLWNLKDNWVVSEEWYTKFRRSND